MLGDEQPFKGIDGRIALVSGGASRIGLYATRANLIELNRQDGAAIKHAWQIAERLCQGLREIFQERGIAAIVQGVGPMFQIFFTGQTAIQDYRAFCAHVDRKKFQAFALALMAQGVYISPSAALHSVASSVHMDDEVDFTLQAVRKALSYVEG